MACRFPGAASPAEFWRNLESGICSVDEIPSDRFDTDALYAPELSVNGKMATRRGGFLPRVDEWDAEYFGVSPEEARAMDPQQRLLLEVAVEALDDAGLSTEDVFGTAGGVFIGGR